MLELLLAILMAVSLSTCASAPPPPAAAAPDPHTVAPAVIPPSTASREAAGLFDEAIALADAGHYAESDQKLKAALELDPNFALAHASLVGSGSQEEDREHRERARALSGSLPRLEQLWAAVLIASESELASALAALDAEHSDDWRIQRELGNLALYRTLDKPLARQAFERVLVLRPEQTRALDALAYLYSDEARWPEALKKAERQVELLPAQSSALETLGEVQLMASKLEAAEYSFRRAVEVDPAASSAYEGLASVAFTRDQWPAGIETLGQAIAATTDPKKQGDLRQVLIWALVAESRDDEARTLLEQSLAADDKLAAIKRGLFELQIAMERGRWNEAEQKADALTEQANGAPRVLVRLGGLRPVIEARMGKLTEADASLARLATQLEGQPPYMRKELSMARAEIALAQGKTADALAALGDKWIANHCSLQDPGRALGRPGFEHYALSVRLLEAEALLRGGRMQEAQARLTALSGLKRRGIGAQAVLRRARVLLAELAQR